MKGTGLRDRHQVIFNVWTLQLLQRIGQFPLEAIKRNLARTNGSLNSREGKVGIQPRLRCRAGYFQNAVFAEDNCPSNLRLFPVGIENQKYEFRVERWEGVQGPIHVCVVARNKLQKD